MIICLSFMLPQFEVSFFPAQIFWLIVCFGIFYVFVKYSFLPKITDILAKREAKIKADMLFYEHNILEIAKSKEAYEKIILDAKFEADEQIKKAKLSSQKFIEERILEIDKTMNARFESIKSELETEISTVRNQLKQEALISAVNILKKIEGEAPNEEELKKYLA